MFLVNKTTKFNINNDDPIFDNTYDSNNNFIFDDTYDNNDNDKDNINNNDKKMTINDNSDNVVEKGKKDGGNNENVNNINHSSDCHLKSEVQKNNTNNEKFDDDFVEVIYLD